MTGSSFIYQNNNTDPRAAVAVRPILVLLYAVLALANVYSGQKCCSAAVLKKRFYGLHTHYTVRVRQRRVSSTGPGQPPGISAGDNP